MWINGVYCLSWTFCTRQILNTREASSSDEVLRQELLMYTIGRSHFVTTAFPLKVLMNKALSPLLSLPPSLSPFAINLKLLYL